MRTSAASGLADALGSEGLVRKPDALEGWSVSGRTPEAVVFPRTVDELAEVLERASEEGWPVVPAGAGSWLDGGGPTADVRLVVSTRRMRSVVEYEPGDLTLTAEAGLSLATLEKTVREHGQWLPQDPPGRRRTTLGAFVSTGLPGPLVAGYGRPRDQLLGLTAVTGDGRILRPGGRVVKNVAGYDLVRLLAGSWGTLAVIAGATVRLFPHPERDVTLLFRAGAPTDLVETGRALATAPVVPEALELLAPVPTDDAPGGRGRSMAGADVREAAADAAVAVRLLGSPEAVPEKVRIVRDAAGMEPDTRLVGNASARFHDRMTADRSDEKLALRLTLLPARLRRLMEEGQELYGRARARRLRPRMAIHLTRGVLRIEMRPSPESGPFGEDWIQVLVDVRRRIREDGGSLTVVRGPRFLVEAVGFRGEADATERLVRDLKEEFDPAGILAPGRLGLPGGGW